MSWADRRIEHIASEVRPTVDPSEFGEEDVEHYSIPALDATGEPEVQPASEIQSAKQLLRGGEVLISRLNPRKARVLRVPRLGERTALASGEFVVLRPRCDARFLEYLLLAETTRQNLDGAVQSVTRSHQRIRPEHLMKMTVRLPAQVEAQRAIADFLDAETARIDALMTKKRLLANVIGERTAAETEVLLNSAATRQVPLRRVLAEPPTYGAGESGVEGEDGWPRYIRITDLDDEGELRSSNILRLPPEVARPYLLRHGDLLIARSGATVGKAFMYQKSVGASAFAGYLIRFRPDPDVVMPELLRAWTRTSHYWSQVKLAALQATIENVSADKYKDFLIPLPPRSDQEDLTRAIERQEKRSKAIVSRLGQQITLLQEHRQALITAAVAGELDVVGAAA